ncbi:alpha/beta hydrolase family protein [Alteromonas gilva]|uniref:4-O-methyl-glucuronoyl methylesterase-like domain-containing protein n=1 Tax=Alteromonas gilva TaxID=2987522 RepID=A0ABT5L5Z9_9ALTE|nr:hypothetical protein [Alteromonas gilva]MDC8832292.1 hypothetical protein [Alteromonas gilva]
MQRFKVLTLFVLASLGTSIQASANNANSGKPLKDDTACPVYAAADFAQLNDIRHLPNPFVYGKAINVTSRSQWQCARAWTKAQFEHWELGPLPPAPPVVSGTVTARQLTVHASASGNTIAFNAQLHLPAIGKAPFPAMIRLGEYGLDTQLFNDAGVAVITYNNGELAEQNNQQSRGRGKFYELFGSDHPAGAMMAWSWGISRILDVIENTDQQLIDSTRIGVTGCSRNGKGAIVAGAFDERIQLTIAQESGSGGAASWRISDYQQQQGQNVQTQQQIVTENVWFRDNFSRFSGATTQLPVDHHQLMGLLAPRGLLVLENTSMEWLGNSSTFITSQVAKSVWQALGTPQNIGISQVGGHRHCQLPASQQPAVQQFVSQFLLQSAANTRELLQTDGQYSTSAAEWRPWATPTLRPD